MRTGNCMVVWIKPTSPCYTCKTALSRTHDTVSAAKLRSYVKPTGCTNWLHCMLNYKGRWSGRSGEEAGRVGKAGSPKGVFTRAQAARGSMGAKGGAFHGGASGARRSCSGAADSRLAFAAVLFASTSRQPRSSAPLFFGACLARLRLSNLAFRARFSLEPAHFSRGHVENGGVKRA